MNNYMFHVHTYRCGHAGDEREVQYIEKAIELGAEKMYFCDHGPFEGNPFGNRMSYDSLGEYVSTLQQLKKRYEEIIGIRISLEMEYVPAYRGWYEELLGSGNFDMLLLGQHFSWIPEENIYSFKSREKIAEPEFLAEGMIQGMESGLFQVVAHPDQIFRRMKSWGEREEMISQEIKECAVRNGIYLEKNISNMIAKKKRRVYWPEFWEDVPRGLKTVYGVDAHSVKELEEHYKFQLELMGNDIA